MYTYTYIYMYTGSAIIPRRFSDVLGMSDGTVYFLFSQLRCMNAVDNIQFVRTHCPIPTAPLQRAHNAKSLLNKLFVSLRPSSAVLLDIDPLHTAYHT